MGKLDGKAAIVTGASRGIGAEIARTLAAEGARVIWAARTLREGDHPLAGSLEHTVGNIRQAGGEATPVPVNISLPEDCEKLVQETRAIYGPVDLLVNNAALTYYIPVKDYPLNRWMRSWAVNFHAPFLLSKLVLEDMIPRGSGAIVNISSAAAVGPGRGPYPDAPPAAAAPAMARRRPPWNVSLRGWRWRCTNTASQSPALLPPRWCRRPEPSFITWLAAWTTPGASRRS